MVYRPGRRRVVTTTATALAALVATSVPATAADPSEPVRATGEGGATLTVSQVTDLDPAGQTLRVTGEGFDEAVGIYVTLCVVPPVGEQPTPCLGGVDLEGETGASAWISSSPPSYGEGLATAYGPGGTFDVELQVARADEFTDCGDTDVAPDGCAVVVRADHTRTADRSQDVLVPVTFAGSGETGWAAPLALGGTVGVVVLGGAAAVVRRRRRGRDAVEVGHPVTS